MLFRPFSKTSTVVVRRVGGWFKGGNDKGEEGLREQR